MSTKFMDNKRDYNMKIDLWIAFMQLKGKNLWLYWKNVHRSRGIGREMHKMLRVFGFE